MKWFVMEEIPKSHALFTAVPFRGFCRLDAFGITPSLPQGAIHERHGTATLMFPRSAFQATGKAVLEKVLSDPAWADALNARIRSTNAALFEASEALKDVNWTALDGPKLAELYAGLLEKQVAAHTCGIPWVVLEFEHALLTRHVMRLLKECIELNAPGFSAAETFSILTTPVDASYAQLETQSLLAIAAEIRDARVRKLFESDDLGEISRRLSIMQPDVARQLDVHTESFCWLPYMYAGPAWEKTYFVQVLKGLLLLDVDALLEQSRDKRTDLIHAQQKLLEKIRADDTLRHLLAIARDIVYTKAYRKDCLYHFFWRLEPFLKAASKKLGLTLKQVRRMEPEELILALQTGNVDADELNRRWENHVFWVRPDGTTFPTGKKAQDFMEALDLEKPDADASTSELSGECACPGFAQGTVKVVGRADEMAKMNDGDVLVAHATNPDIVPAMKKASAIVTDLGGITCHAAIVSRELRIPCVIGTKHATRVLKDGDVVSVDATHGVVRKF